MMIFTSSLKLDLTILLRGAGGGAKQCLRLLPWRIRVGNEYEYGGWRGKYPSSVYIFWSGKSWREAGLGRGEMHIVAEGLLY